MAKEFDIYLNRQITRCDIIVYSLPYRDDLRVANELVLKSCLESCLLLKSLAVATGSAVTAHIEKTYKTCCERLGLSTAIGANAALNASALLDRLENGIALGADDVAMLKTAVIGAEGALALGVERIRAVLKIPFVSMSNVVQIGAEAKEVKRAIMAAADSVRIDATAESGKRSFLRAEAAVAPEARLNDLFYHIYSAASTAVGIAQIVAETEFHYSLGRSSSGLKLQTGIGTELVTKYETVDSVVAIALEAVASAQKILEITAPLCPWLDVDPTWMRRRTLAEADGLTLAELDDLMLTNVATGECVDYIII